MALNFEQARKNMIDCQIVPNNIVDQRIIDAMATTPREEFVPLPMQGIAYADDDVQLGMGRILQEPLTMARMIQAAKIQSDDVVLLLGAGTGYTAAILGALCSTVVGIEPDTALAKQADKLLHDLDVCNAVVISEDQTIGYPRQAPYDVIYINGGVEEISEDIMHQLKEGGRLVTVVAGTTPYIGEAVCFTRQGDQFIEEHLFETRSHILTGFEAEAEFSF